MSSVERTMRVEAPIRAVYDQWTQFEEFPRFMEGITSVRQLDDTHLHWTAEIAGRRKEWDAEILEQVPERRISWASTSGARNAGVVTFERIGENMTEVSLRMDVEPEDPVEQIGDAVGILDQQVHGDLERFKEFIENRGAATGAWRGTVRGGVATEEPSQRN
jgi:uncharacterized membrane protein